MPNDEEEEEYVPIDYEEELGSDTGTDSDMDTESSDSDSSDSDSSDSDSSDSDVWNPDYWHFKVCLKFSDSN